MALIKLSKFLRRDSKIVANKYNGSKSKNIFAKDSESLSKCLRYGRWSPSSFSISVVKLLILTGWISKTWIENFWLFLMKRWTRLWGFTSWILFSGCWRSINMRHNLCWAKLTRPLLLDTNNFRGRGLMQLLFHQTLTFLCWECPLFAKSVLIDMINISTTSKMRYMRESVNTSRLIMWLKEGHWDQLNFWRFFSRKDAKLFFILWRKGDQSWNWGMPFHSKSSWMWSVIVTKLKR